ncbi:hypothetical protein [Staphylococcus aureus]|uniref:hypothetical protein n=1 Tax=Staphylococcus aureus TaxID=1280 RepID=UPI0009836AA0|nr:hypothetical protein [Staphylococcus aureus]AQR26669.1 hypothetical protein AYM28_15345 [Staphylococcus aureus]AQR53188.1 hypothetical protein AYM37_15345 [Staphylococcus aureus]
MNSYENVLLQMIFSILLIYFIFISCYKLMLLPKQKYSSTYVDIKAIIKYGIVASVKLIITLLTTGIIFHAFKETKLKFPTQQDSNDVLIFLIFVTFALVISVLTIITLKSIYRFFNKLIFYISLRKNTVSNNLRHAIANKDQSNIIKYNMLMKQADENIDLSIDEVLTLMASLMYAGYHEDVKEILTPKLRKKQSIFQRFMRNNPEMVEYEIKGIDNSTDKSETFKHKLSIFEEKAQKIATLIMIALIVQLVVILLSSMGVVSDVFKGIFIMVLSIVIIATLVIKYLKLKNMYQHEFKYEKNQIKLKQAPLDKIQLGLTVVMFLIGITNLIFYVIY